MTRQPAVCNLSILFRVASWSAFGPRVMECVRDATYRRHVGRDSGGEPGESLVLVGRRWQARLRIKGIEFRGVQVAALCWRPRRVGSHGDHAPVGDLLGTVFRQASPGFPDTLMPMPTAPAPVPDGGVYVSSLRHLGSLVERPFLASIHQSKQAARQPHLEPPARPRSRSRRRWVQPDIMIHCLRDRALDGGADSRQVHGRQPKPSTSRSSPARSPAGSPVRGLPGHQLSQPRPAPASGVPRTRARSRSAAPRRARPQSQVGRPC